MSVSRPRNNPEPLNQAADTIATEAGALGHVPSSVERLSAAGPTHDEIARRAFELFEDRGREPGHEWEDWFRAEREL
jgi:Protein of unknown function (DUF2934)